MKIIPINRVVGESALVDEFIFEFTHNTEVRASDCLNEAQILYIMVFINEQRCMPHA